MKENGQTILVLDDDPDIGNMIRMILELRGFRVLVAERADQARAIVHEHPVDLVIMDLLLSGDSGTDTCHAFKSAPSTSSVPIIMISAHPNAREICLDSGADDFLEKPFDMQDMYRKIDSVLDRVQGLE
jgi:DNA-binding response OmpR family regulator